MTDRPKIIPLLTVENIKRALEEYDRTANDRIALLSRIETHEDVVAYLKAESDAEERVARAFYEDTKDRNSLEKCLFAGRDIGWMRKLVAKFDRG